MPLAEAPVLPMRYHLSPNVLSARAGDAIVLMDRRRGTYHTLNEVGGRVWELAGEGATEVEIVERLLDEYDVARLQLEHDVRATLRQLVDDRLLAPGIPSNPGTLERAPTPAPHVRRATGLTVPSVFRCGVLMAWFKVLLRARGFLGTLEWIRRRIEPLPAISEAGLETVKAVEYAVAMAGALYPGRAKCLEQSLTLYYLLRIQGVAAVYCQGVQPYPFQAHAWIEYQGDVINDVPEHIRYFARLQEQLP